MSREEWTPRQIVAELDKYIVGQRDAKKCVAVALRNRYRRKLLADDIRDEVFPKNIIMIGPTGVGKTEIARRLAKLVSAPFVKVEATKFTEVGYVGRDVETMIRDLVETSIRIVQTEKMEIVGEKAQAPAAERLLELLAPKPEKQRSGSNPLSLLFSSSASEAAEEDEPEFNEKIKDYRINRERLKEQLAGGLLEDETVEMEVDERAPVVEVFSGSGMEDMGINFQDLMGQFFPKRKRMRRLPVRQARKILQQEEAQKLIDMDEVITEAVSRAEQSGIIFLDEIDKIAGKDYRGGPDVSREGVQRDILPIVEGSTVTTKYGAVKTDFILFIAAGAFHVAKPADLIPELQGRFPIRVELNSLTETDFKQILTEPANALIKQYTALLETEGVTVEFRDDAIGEIAKLACTLNNEMENIGARRLHTILEKLLEELSFNAPELPSQLVKITAEYVQDKLNNIVRNKDLSRYIL
ncbi:MAG: ATP-dependent protease ATPase subunit HslU [Firmicutes bacterium]|nr:ATP-dependent protease ATPase subunit HslU [Dethiobacter sp.]MBS3897915.1 ATP-dependent protease ATPase subunit HslU [Dethiobacter sp.]MCL4462984.1 ATP-dependent protease ATPase subunit HslU [Bacillota bacterium]MCL5993219.1 ATP-dependent protease ATPase subunit HslU [Bacillota bacterium]